MNQLNSNTKLDIIKDKETINWIKEWFVNCFENGTSSNVWSLLLHSIVNQKLMNYGNVELSKYAFNQLPLFTWDEFGSRFYYIPLLNAIVNQDFQTIKFIHSLGVTFIDNVNLHLFEICHFNQLLSNTAFGSTGINYKELNKIIKYLNPSSSNSMIGFESFYKLIGFIVENGYYNNRKYNNNVSNGLIKFDLEMIQINLDDKESVIHNLHEVCNNYNHFKFLLENIKFTNQGSGSGGEENINELMVQDNLIFNDKHQDKTKFIISLIHLIIDQLKQQREINNQQQQQLQIYYGFLNLLFNSLAVNNNDIKLEQINQVYRLMCENYVEFELGIQLKLVYIKCVSPILYNYLKRISSISNTPLQNLPLPQFKINNSFDKLLEILIYRPYKQNQLNSYGNLHKYSNEIKDCNLQFFLQIKRIDLYLNEWNFIKSTANPKKPMYPSFQLIKSCCINLELNLILDTLKEIEDNFKSDTKLKLLLLFKICNGSLKLGTFEITKLAINTLIKCSNNNQIPIDELFFKILNCNDYNFILENRNSISLTITDKIKQFFIK